MAVMSLVPLNFHWAMHVKYDEVQTFSRWCDAEVARGVPAQVSFSSFDHDSKLRVNRLQYIKLYCRNSNLGHHTDQANVVRGVVAHQIRKAFDVVKAAITKSPVLKLSDFQKLFELFTDVSSIRVGAVLNQEQRPVVFASRMFSGAERASLTFNIRDIIIVQSSFSSRSAPYNNYTLNSLYETFNIYDFDLLGATEVYKRLTQPKY
ncbi:hypothetical protein TNCV_3248281 [Trichonephila clavipes]|nr:hypothetical protein TNCV_3248281 [Trichonephila clavipes]